MKKQKTEKLNRGITLVALVITIIVMLILVGVTISMAVNGGLFDYAGKAVGETNNVMKEEGQLANSGIQINGKWYESIDDYIYGNAITAVEISENLKSYLGKEVAYGVTYSDQSVAKDSKWEIFYADKNHVYIITKGCTYGRLSSGASTGTGDFTEENLKNKYPAVAAGLFYKTYDPSKTPALQYDGLDTDGSSYPNMRKVLWLLDSTKWTAFLDSEGLADWAIGSPTMEMFAKSAGRKISTPSGYGYSDDFSVPQGSYLSHYTSGSNEPAKFWIAAPSDDTNGSLCCYYGDYGLSRKNDE